MTQLSLDQWIKRIAAANSRTELFAILDEFRPLPWCDEERAQIAKIYIRVIDNLPDDGATAATTVSADEKPANDGPVWYEKM